MNYEANLDFARNLDQQDVLGGFRDKFYIPEQEGKPSIYFCGNSLGLQPKTVAGAITAELQDWQNLGVDGHFKDHNPWYEYHKLLKPGLIEVAGANDLSEVTPMGSLTSNLHLLLVSFYKPNKQRFKIIMEAGAFPSDQYAIETQCRFHGFDPEEAIIEIAPEPGSHTISTERIIKCIEQNGEQLALVLFSGIQYYSGQFFDMEAITRAGHRIGALVGWDLAHAIGNVPLRLHQHQVDFATWCSYKYLNSGPGGTAGIFVHQKHGDRSDLQRFGGWWGYPESKRFEMKKGFIAANGADGWQLSNANILSMAAQKASLDLFLDAEIKRLREKSKLMTGLLEFLLDDISASNIGFRIITPKDTDARGAQLSLTFDKNGTEVFDGLTSSGVVVDWRKPNNIRVAPAPMYNTFEEVYRFYEVLKKLIE